MKSKDGLAQMVQDLVEDDEAGSLRQYLQKDGELRAGDVMRISSVLADLGFTSEEDLDILVTAFFETMADAEDVPAVMIFKLWRTLHHSDHIPTDDRYGRKGYGIPSYPATRAILDQMAFNKRQRENLRPPPQMSEGKRESPAEQAETSGFEDLHETTIKANESAHVLKG